MSRRIAAILTVIGLLGGCSNASSAETESSSVVNTASAEKRTAKDNAVVQTEDAAKATRVVPENGTPIVMYFGDTEVDGVLNDSETAQSFIAKLPYTQHMNRYSHDFCGVTEELPYEQDEEHYGWLNGDIDYATDAPYFTILFKDEDISEQYGSQVNIGVVTSDLSVLDGLTGSYDVRIELKDTEEETMNKTITFEVNGNPVKFELNDSNAAEGLFEQLPSTVSIENYSDNEKTFYPQQKLDTANTPLAEGVEGELAYFEPWGDVVMYYGYAGPYSGLYSLGKCVEGQEYIQDIPEGELSVQ